MRYVYKFIHYLAVFLVACLLLFSIGLALLQTEWVKTKIRNQLISELAFMNLEAEKIEGRIPFDIQITGVKGKGFTIPSLQIRLALFPLLRGEAAISYLYAKKIQVTPEQEENTPFAFSWNALQLPFTISLRSINIPELQIGKIPPFSVTGSIRVKKRAKEVVFDLNAFDTENRLTAAGFAGQKEGYLHLTGKIDSFSPIPHKGSFDVTLTGPMPTWIALMEQKKGEKPLEGHAILHATEVNIPGWEMLNREWQAELFGSLFADFSVILSKAEVKSDLIELSGSGKKDTFGISVDTSFRFPHLLYKQVEGSSFGTFHFDPSSYKLVLNTDDLYIGREKTQGTLTLGGIFENHLWKGDLILHTENDSFPLEGLGRYLWNPGFSFTVSGLDISSGNSQIQANVEYLFSPKSVTGDIFAQIGKIEALQGFFPKIPIKGQLGMEIHFGKEQTATVHASLKNGQFYKTKAKDLTIHANLAEFFTDTKGSFQITGENVAFAKTTLSSLNFTTCWQDHKWPYTLKVKGEGLELESEGFYEENRLGMSSFSGFASKRPFAIENPLEIVWKKEEYAFHNLNLKFAGGTLLLDFLLSPENISGTVKGVDIPLDIVNIFYPSFELKGLSSFEGNLGKNGGRFSLIFSGEENKLAAKGSLQATFNENILQLHTQIQEKEGEFLWTLTLPVQLQFTPFSLAVDKSKNFASEISMEGKLEDIFDFIDLGIHRISGKISTHLYLSKTLSSPSIRGSLDLKNGSYENYLTGTHVKDIEMKAAAENQTITIEKAFGTDGKEGNFTAKGQMLFDPQKHFPYLIQTDLQKIHAVNFEMVSGSVSGPLEISGSLKEAKAEGNLTVDKAEVEIPDSLPADIPVLNVTYLNKPAEETVSPPKEPSFPFSLSLHFTAPEDAPGRVFVRGRGLRSEWKGKIHLTGTNSQVAATGTLSLLRGEYIFSGQVFTLEEGEIVLSREPYIKLKGTLNLADFTITAMLTGPVTSPLLTFQSTPYLPTSSILSYILFNEDVSNLSPFQAVQLAQLIVNLSGKMGPDVLETIRKKLGVDRLNIVSSEKGAAIQIGKYLTRGVMVTLAQGTDSSQVIVDVDLKHGFLFTAETQPQEQGKFSLKWHKNY